MKKLVYRTIYEFLHSFSTSFLCNNCVVQDQVNVCGHHVAFVVLRLMNTEILKLRFTIKRTVSSEENCKKMFTGKKPVTLLMAAQTRW